MKLYPVNVAAATFESGVNMWVNLKTAKALSQVKADGFRAEEHLKQKALKWERRHSDKKVYWWGFIDDRLYVNLKDRF